ncbi:Uncharacterised protein [uncultured archaeon]|nr:Uncharacterised protein [uncultured archaeon]
MIDLMRAIWDEKVVTITPDLLSSVPMRTSHTRSLAICSEGVLPDMDALVVSVISATTPSFPRALSLAKSGGSPSVGLLSILKSLA